MQNTYLYIALGAFLLVGATTMLFMHNTNVAAHPKRMVDEFKKWQKNHHKSFSDPDNEVYRLNVFSENLKKIESHPIDSDYTLGQNQFMDLTKVEFKHYYLGLLDVERPANNNIFVSHETAPANVDWRTKGAVSAVKDQGQCGSCWAFSTTGSLESVAAIKGSGLGSFSEQQLVDCSSSYGNMGCNGGLMDYAFQYVIAKGITTEAKYPYKAVDQTCKTQGGTFKISKYTDVASGNCNSLKTAVAGQPVAIGVDAEEWQFYSGGVFNNCGSQLDHGVLAVGYQGTSYWIVKNSWGGSWGEQGYIRLANGNTCGICNTASFPTI